MTCNPYSTAGPVSGSWQATTFLIGEYAEEELRDIPSLPLPMPVLVAPDGGAEFDCAQVADHQATRQDSVPGLHTFRITMRCAGLLAHVWVDRHAKNPHHRRLSFGIAELDKMLGVAFAKAIVFYCRVFRTGKSVWQPNLSRRAYAMENRELWPCLKSARKLCGARRQPRPGSETPQKRREAHNLYLRPLDLSVDETMHSISTQCKDWRQAPGDRFAGRL